jgi:hypothetical protein
VRCSWAISFTTVTPATAATPVSATLLTVNTRLSMSDLWACACKSGRKMIRRPDGNLLVGQRERSDGPCDPVTVTMLNPCGHSKMFSYCSLPSLGSSRRAPRVLMLSKFCVFGSVRFIWPGTKCFTGWQTSAAIVCLFMPVILITQKIKKLLLVPAPIPTHPLASFVITMSNARWD